MRAAIYARYSSENQRPESIEDQIGACRRLASERGFRVLEDHVYADQAQSGARRDREGLGALVAAAQNEQFDVVLVDDLSRLARDNYLMLSVIAELHFEGVRVISVADGLDSEDEEATLGIQIRGIFNELQLRDLKKKTLRGQRAQKERGFSVGERTFGFKSVPVGTIQMDKKGRPRPEGYKMEIELREAAVVLRIFKAYADGLSLTRIGRMLNEEKVPGRMRAAKGWSPATVSRILDNEKYIARWVWNKTESRRDPRTGRRRRFTKPESEWVVQEDEALRIVPAALWEQAQVRRQEVRRSWPGGKGRRGFSRGQGGRERHFPTHLLSGSMVCGECGATIAQVSGKAGGYYGCLGAAKGACENKMLVRRKLAETIILKAVREQLDRAEHIRYLIERVEAEVAKLYAHTGDGPDQGGRARRRRAASRELRRLHRRRARQPGARQGPGGDGAPTRGTSRGAAGASPRVREGLPGAAPGMDRRETRRHAAGAGEANGALGHAAPSASREDQTGTNEGRDRAALLHGPDHARHPVAARAAPGRGRPGSRFEFFAMVEAAGIEPASD
jgi:site-specific DNA recombinase